MSVFFSIETSLFQGFEFITVKSNALKKRADMTIYKPKGYKKFKGIVILLHGVYGSHWAWAAKGNVHETAQRLIDQNLIKPMLLVMPSDGLFGDGSGYLPHKNSNYEKWIVEDVIHIIQNQIPEINSETPIFITGLSMGGFGALRLGAKYPEKFKGFSGLSSVTHFNQMEIFVSDFNELKENVIEQDGVLEWILKNKEKIAPFRFDCGTEDLLLEYNQKLHLELGKQNISHTYEEYSGAHTWEYWTKYIEKSLLFFNQFC